MESSILNSIGIDPGIIVIVMMGIMIFVLLYMVRVSMKMTRFMKRYRIFMKGKDADVYKRQDFFFPIFIPSFRFYNLTESIFWILV